MDLGRVGAARRYQKIKRNKVIAIKARHDKGKSFRNDSLYGGKIALCLITIWLHYSIIGEIPNLHCVLFTEIWVTKTEIWVSLHQYR